MAERAFPLPIPRQARVHPLQLAQFLHPVHRHLEAVGQALVFVLEENREGQQVIAVAFQHPVDRADPMRTKRFPGHQLPNHEVEQLPSHGQAGTAQREDVARHPVGQGAKILGQGLGLLLGLTGQGQRLGQVLPAAVPLGPLHAVFELPSMQSVSGGAMFQIERHGPQIPLGMEDVPMAGNRRPGGGLPGPQTLAAVGDRVVEGQSVVAQIQQMNAPGGLVAVVFGRQQVTVGALHVDAHQDRPMGLVDLVVGPDANGTQILVVADGAGLRQNFGQHVVDRADTEVLVVEDGVEDIEDTAEGRVPDQRLGQDELVNPVLGYGQSE